MVIACQTEQGEWIQCPLFSGIKVDTWIIDIQNFFHQFNIPTEQHVNLASHHIIGLAKKWVFENAYRIVWMNWCTFVEALRSEFEESQCDIQTSQHVCNSDLCPEPVQGVAMAEIIAVDDSSYSIDSTISLTIQTGETTKLQMSAINMNGSITTPVTLDVSDKGVSTHSLPTDVILQLAFLTCPSSDFCLVSPEVIFIVRRVVLQIGDQIFILDKGGTILQACNSGRYTPPETLQTLRAEYLVLLIKIILAVFLHVWPFFSEIFLQNVMCGCVPRGGFPTVSCQRNVAHSSVAVYAMFSSKMPSPKHGYTNSFQNGGGAEVYSLQSSKGATPSTSNFEEEMMNGKKKGGRSMSGDLNGGVVTSSYPPPNPMFSGSGSAGKKKIEGGGNPNNMELHMFVWSSIASPASEGNLRNAVNRAAATDFGVVDSSKVVLQQEIAASRGTHDFNDSTFATERERFRHTRRAIQGSLIIASIVNIILGYSRVWGHYTRFFSHVSIVPIVCVAGLGLFDRGFPKLAQCVELGLPMFIFLVISQHIFRGLHKKGHTVFVRFGLLFCAGFMWAFAAILTVAGAYNFVRVQTKIICRTDRSFLISSAPWVKIPYPFQWGAPIFRASYVFGMMGAALIVHTYHSEENGADYYAGVIFSVLVCFYVILLVKASTTAVNASSFDTRATRVDVPAKGVMLMHYEVFYVVGLIQDDQILCGNTTRKGTRSQESAKRTLLDAIREAPVKGGFPRPEVLVSGSMNDSAFVLANCWRTVNESSCRKCPDNASTSIMNCFPWSEAVILNTGCFLRYSDTYFLNAERILQTYNGTLMPGTEQTFRLNWASFGIGERGPEAGPEHSIFVGDLAPDVTDYVLEETFQVQYPLVRGAKVVTDPNTGGSKGCGFVKFQDEMEINRAMSKMNGVYCSTRPMRISAATPKNATGFQQPQQQYTAAKAYPAVATAYTTPAVQQVPAVVDNDINNTTIIVGGLDANIAEEELRQIVAPFGEIVYVNIPQGKGCGFVQFAARPSAEDAIQRMNGTVIGKQTIRVSWAQTTDPFLKA